jgi:AcrR family transcriptional regulator
LKPERNIATPTTRTKILDAAERRFAERGYDATSIREITREAGVNVAAVHYHFGGKEDVLRGVTDRIVGPLNDRRIELLEASHRRSDPPPLEEILDAFIRPDVETLQRLQRRGPTVAHFLGRTYSDPTPWIREMTSEQFGEAGTRFVPAIAAAIPEVPITEIRWRMTHVAAVIVNLFATWPEKGMTDDEAETTIDGLVRFLSGALSAEPARPGKGGGNQ